ncbi:MAG TPA: DUF1622 domain-containing protein [Terriglobia bacterium]|nr:DUF1622 domain-containing protein [Terriglobia bacterium]
MENVFEEIALAVALTTEAAAVFIIAFGALQAVIGLLRYGLSRKRSHGARKEIWLGLAVWLLLGLEFELAADIVRSVITPDWEDIGQLAAIAVIRTFLNYFLEKDLEKYGEPEANAA